LYCKHGVAHKEGPQGKIGWDEGSGWNQENWTTTIVANCYTCWKLYHTPKAFEEATKGEDDWREKREGN